MTQKHFETPVPMSLAHTMSRRRLISRGTLLAGTVGLGFGGFGGFGSLFAARAQEYGQEGEAMPPDGFVLLAGGEFFMGSPENERQRDADEVRHRVRVSPFYIDPYEVRQRDYEALMGVNPSARKGADLPVEKVSWFDAVRYANALSRERNLAPAYSIEGEAVVWHRAADGYRLLTEAEWEYAARAGSESIFQTGRQLDPEVLNYQGNYPYLMEENYVVTRDPSVRPGRNRSRTVAVGELGANAFGLFNMSGNVSEWVFDYYGAYPEGKGDDAVLLDPTGPQEGGLRVARGGAFNDFGKHLRLAYRSACNPIVCDRNQGFRLARNAQDAKEKPLGDFATAAPRRFAMPDAPRVFLAWFSYSGNTRDAAKLMAQRLGIADFEIRMRNPYHGEIYEVSQRDMNAHARPELVGNPAGLKESDVVLLGYPTWWATVPPPVLTFLEQNDFAGKIIMPFSSHGSTDFGESLSTLAKTVPEAYIAPGLAFYYSGGRSLSERIDVWLELAGLRKAPSARS